MDLMKPTDFHLKTIQFQELKIKNNSYEREVLGKERTKGGLGKTIRATRKRPVDIMPKKGTYYSFVRDHRKTSLLILSEFERIN